jgi:hypothetical protein
MGIIGTIGGRFSTIKRHSNTIVSSGTGAISGAIYTCPANTTTRIAPPAFTDSQTNTVSNAQFTVTDGITGEVYSPTTATTIAVTSGAYKRIGWIPQQVSLNTAGAINFPAIDTAVVTASTNELFLAGKYDPQTNQLILREGDILSFASTAFSAGGSHTTSFLVEIEEEST